MQVERIDLSGGQWVKAHTRPTVNQMDALDRATKANSMRGQSSLETLKDIVLILCTEWQVRGEDGANLPLSKDGIGDAPWDTVQELSDALAPYLGASKTLQQQLLALVEDREDDDEVKIRVIDFAASLGNS